MPSAICQALRANGSKDAGMEQFINANLALAHYNKQEYAAIPYFEKIIVQYPHFCSAYRHSKIMVK